MDKGLGDSNRARHLRLHLHFPLHWGEGGGDRGSIVHIKLRELGKQGDKWTCHGGEVGSSLSRKEKRRAEWHKKGMKIMTSDDSS